jgi:ribosome-binding factor A
LEYPRSYRVGELILKHISEILSRGLKDPRVGFVTLTSVDVSSDLRYARVYYTVIGSERERSQTAIGIEKATPYIRRQLASKLSIRHTPELTFVYDESIEYGAHIESILKDINNEPGNDSDDSEQD